MRTTELLLIFALGALIFSCTVIETPDLPLSYGISSASGPGKDGKDGKDGEDGEDGKDGIDGNHGKDGEDGEDGADGKDGNHGKDGEDGKDGADGNHGKDGENGKDGEAGKDGENGKDGKDGKDGEDGTNCDVESDESDGAYWVMKCGEVVKARWAKAMCGNVPYDPEVESCEASCGTVPYDPDVQMCDYRDYKVYKYVKIGEQTWMAENLNYEAEGSRCYGEGGIAVLVRTPFGNRMRVLSDKEVQENCDTYGRLYDWDMAMNNCPSCWHLPTADEWMELIDYAGGRSIAGTKLKATSGWPPFSYNDANGLVVITNTDDYGFAALPGSGYSAERNEYWLPGWGSWWTASESEYSDNDVVYTVGMAYLTNGASAKSGANVKSYFNSVRCVKDV